MTTQAQNVTTAIPNAILGKPYQGAYRQELEKEPETPATQATDPSTDATQEPGPELAPEERNYKTRYDSLKAHYDKMIVESRKREVELTTQLTKAKNKMEVPSNPEEFKTWKSQYPDLYRMIISVAREELSTTATQIDEKFNQLELLSRQARRDKAEASLMRLHPDFEELKASEDFHKWVREQPAQIQAWLYDNEDDPLLAAKAIELYKAEKGVSRKPKTQPKPDIRDAAVAVTKTSKTNEPEVPQGKVWKLSEIKKLSRSQFERVEDEIDKARIEGRIDYDI